MTLRCECRVQSPSPIGDFEVVDGLTMGEGRGEGKPNNSQQIGHYSRTILNPTVSL